ncbi:MAG: alkaline phosphatase, partial [Rubrobacteraceae bacterium]
SYAEDNPDTLLIATADHETGGLAVEGAKGNKPGSYEDGPFRVAGTDRSFSLGWTTKGHSSVPVPVTAEGPGAKNLTGVYENTHVYDVMKEALLRESGEAG